MITALQSYVRFSLHGLLVLASGVSAFVVGLIVLMRNPRDLAHRAFLMTTTAAFFWSIGCAMMSLVAKPAHVWFWFAVTYLPGVPFISPSFYLFTRAWMQKPVNRTFFGLLFLGALAIAIPVSFFGSTFYEILDKGWGRFCYIRWEPMPIAYQCVNFTFFMTWAMMSFFNFAKALRTETNSNRRTQIRYIVTAFMIAYTAVVDYLVATIHRGYPFGYISLTIFVFIVGYAIGRHRLMGINVAARRLSVLVLIYGVLLAFAVPILTFLLRGILAPVGSHEGWRLLGAAAVMSALFSLGPFIYAFAVKRSFWLRESMAAGLTHELKSPLGSIQSAVELAVDRVRSGLADNRTLEYLEMISRNADRLHGFAKDLLTVVGQEEKRVETAREHFNAEPVLRSLLATYEPRAREKGLSLSLDAAPALPVFADRRQFEQVASNILTNAVKFTDTGKIILRAAVDDGEFTVSVTDTGVGIAPEHLPHIFDRFYKTDANRSGSGLGLAIAKAWVEAHGGRIWAESEGLGKGTAVTFTVPVA